MGQKIRIDEVDYDLDGLSEVARADIQALEFITKRIQELTNMMNQFELFSNTEVNLDYVVNNKTLSSGQMQKVSFIRSLLADVELLLLDESTSNLDISSRQLIFNILQSKNITIINSTHNHEDFSYDNHLKIVLKEDSREILSN